MHGEFRVVTVFCLFTVTIRAPEADPQALMSAASHPRHYSDLTVITCTYNAGSLSLSLSQLSRAMFGIRGCGSERLAPRCVINLIPDRVTLSYRKEAALSCF